MPNFRKLPLFFFSHRTLALLRWDLHFLRVRLKNAILLRNRTLYRQVARHNGPFYECHSVKA